MGLLNSMTVRYTVDLAAMRSGTEEVKSLITSVKSIAESASASLQALSTSFHGGELASQVSSATSSITSLAEDAAMTGESLLQTGSDAASMGSEVVSASEEAASGLNNVKGEAESAGGGFSGFMSKVKEAGGNLLDFGAKIGQTVFGLQAMGQAAVGMISGIFSSAQQVEEATNSFEVFDGSMAKAQQEMADLSAFAAHTPFETKSIDDAALKMQSVGINAKDVIPYIHSLGDALDATGRVSGADLDMIVTDFDKIKTSGHLTSDVMNSFALQGIDAWAILEKQTGKTHDQLAAYISKGLYPAKQAMADLTQGIEKNPLYSGQMANDTNSMTGIMSTLKSNWDQALASFASPIMKDLEPVLNGIATDLSSPGFKQFAGEIGSKIAGVFGNIASAAKNIDFKAIGDQVQKLGGWFKTSMQPALEKAEPSFAQLGTTIGNLASSALPPLLQAAGDLAPKVVTVAGDIAGGLNSAITTITGSFSTWSPIVAGVGIALAVVFTPAIIASGVQSVIAGAQLTYNFVAGIIATGVQGWQAAGKLALFVGNLIATGAQATWAGIQLATQFIGSMIASGVQAVIAGGKIVVSFVGALIESGVQAGIAAGAFLSDLIPAVISFAAEAVGAAVTAIPAVLAGFGAWIVGAAGVAVANIVAFWPIYLVILAIVVVVGIVILVIKNWGTIIGWLGEQWGRFVGWVQLQIKVLGIIFSAIGTALHDAWNDGINRVKTIFSGLKSFVQGIWSDIVGGVKFALNAAIDQVNNLIRAINNVTGALHIPAIPLIPHLQTGGKIAPGTWAVTGDPGPNSELVYGGDAGATVFSHSQSTAMLAAAGASAGGRGGDTHLHVYLDSEEIAHYSAESTAEIIVRKLFGHGPVRGAA